MPDPERFELRGQLLAALSMIPDVITQENFYVLENALQAIHKTYAEYIEIPFVPGDRGATEDHRRLSDLIVRMIKLIQEVWDSAVECVGTSEWHIGAELKGIREDLHTDVKGKTGIGMLLTKFSCEQIQEARG